MCQCISCCTQKCHPGCWQPQQGSIAQCERTIEQAFYQRRGSQMGPLDCSNRHQQVGQDAKGQGADECAGHSE